VIGRTFHRWLRVPARRNRGLAFLILACVAFGSTAEFAHHHGNQPQAAQRKLPTSADQADVSRIESSSNNSRSSKSNSQTECLICQLHQNLSSSELNQPSGIGTTEARISQTAASIAVHLSEFTQTQRGRAPPVNL